MVPRSKVVSCYPNDTLETVMKKMLERVVGCIIVLPRDDAGLPLGIVTKTDVIAAWEQGASKTDKISESMGTKMESVLDTDPSGVAAEHFERTKHRHAFVLDKDGKYVGLITAYDIAVETARDHKAWPYTNRDALQEKFKVPTHAH